MLPTSQTLHGGTFNQTTPGNYNQSNVVLGGPASWLRYSPAKPKKGATRISYSITRFIEIPSITKPGTMVPLLITVNIQQGIDQAVLPVSAAMTQIDQAVLAYGARLALGES